MKLTIEIDLDNEAFLEFGRIREARRIIKNALMDFSVKDGYRSLQDLNGNTVGKMEVSE